MGRALLLLVVSLSICININAQTSDWKLAKNENGIQVYTRKTDASPIKEFKATVIINTDLNTLIETLNNVENYPKWMADCKYAKTLKQVNGNVRYDYIEVNVPWPLENRDIIFSYKSKLDSNKYVAELTSQSDYIDKKEGITRIIKATGKWALSKKSKNEIAVTYQFLGDPEGSIPTWIINLFIVDGPYKTLGNLKEYLKK